MAVLAAKYTFSTNPHVQAIVKEKIDKFG